MGVPEGNDWTALSSEPLPVAAVHDWVGRPDCGAIALFCGTARDHAGDRTGVDQLTYEAYEDQVVPRLDAVVADVRARWPMVGRIAVLHRTGALAIGEVAVVVAVSTPHRGEAFAAAEWAIDQVKATAPIWKKERWAGGEDWGQAAVA